MRAFNPLLDALPETVTVGRREYQLKTDFRVVLAWLRLDVRTDIDEAEKTLMCLRLFIVGDLYQVDVPALFDKVREYVTRGEEPEEGTREPVHFGLLEDSGRVMSAFFQVYRINLRSARLHWWTFCELLEGLPQGTHLAEVIAIRAKPFEKGMTPGQKNALQRAKDRYRIGGKVAPMTGLVDGLKGLFARKKRG